MTNPKLQKLREDNQARAASLGAQGVGIHPLVLLEARLDAIVEHLSCHMKLEEQIASRLDDAEDQLNRAKLTAGLHLPDFGKDNGK